MMEIWYRILVVSMSVMAVSFLCIQFTPKKSSYVIKGLEVGSFFVATLLAATSLLGVILTWK